MEGAHRASLAKGEVGIREKKTVPTPYRFWISNKKKDIWPVRRTKS
jgi:hypothetical protein